MLWHWLTTGWRSLVANPLFSLITIASLSVGCCGALLAGDNIRQHLSFERWLPHADRIVLERQTFGGGSELGEEARMFKIPGDLVNFGLRDAIAGNIPQMVAQTRVVDCSTRINWPGVPPPVPGQLPFPPPPVQTRCVDPDFFKVFDLEFVEGSASSALATPDSFVVTESVARKYFGAGSALGKTIETRSAGLLLRVTGVIRDPPPATDLKLESLASIALRIRMQGVLRSPSPNPTPPGPEPGFDLLTSGQHYLRMADDADPALFMASARHAVDAAFATHMPGVGRPEISMVRLLDVHLGGEELTGLKLSGDRTLLATLATAAAVLLGVSAFNYVTLSLARSLRRRREVGVRKVLGATQGDLMKHYLAESALVTAISLGIGFAMAVLLHPWFARTIGQPETLFGMFDPVFIGGALALFTLLALAVGAYPAFYLANVRPRAGLDDAGAGAPVGMGRFVSGGLLGLQIAAATTLLVVAFTMAAQADYVAKRPLGFDFRNMYTSMDRRCPAGEMKASAPRTKEAVKAAQAAARQCLVQFLDLLRHTQGVGRVSNSNIYGLLDDTILTYGFGRSEKGEELGKAASYEVGFDYLQTMGAKLLAGRFFDPNSAYDQQLTGKPIGQRDAVTRLPVIVTRAILPMLGAATPEAALGQQIRSQEGAPYALEIVGVVEDWHQRSLKYRVYPIIFIPNGGTGIITFEITAAEPDELIQDLRKRWNDIVHAPPQSTLMATPVERSFARFYEADHKLMGAVISFSSVAMIVAAIGVFGLSGFDMRRRVREIGVRKALGATPWRVAARVIGRAVLFAAIASVLAWPVAWWLAESWLSSYVYRTTIGPLLLPVASLIVVVAVMIAVAINAVRAAAIRPSSALRDS